MEIARLTETARAILFFDGECNLCNSTVDFLIKKDRKKKFMYSSLQGELAKKMIPDYIQDIDTFIYVRLEDQKTYEKSSAGLQVFKDLGGIYSLLLIGTIIPTKIRDYIYSHIAKRRYKWFGKNDSCRVASPEEKLLFLD